MSTTTEQCTPLAVTTVVIALQTIYYFGEQIWVPQGMRGVVRTIYPNGYAGIEWCSLESDATTILPTCTHIVARATP